MSYRIVSKSDLIKYLEDRYPRFIVDRFSSMGYEIYVPAGSVRSLQKKLDIYMPLTVCVTVSQLSWWRCRFKKQQVIENWEGP